jgi:hypothetical protein
MVSGSGLWFNFYRVVKVTPKGAWLVEAYEWDNAFAKPSSWPGLPEPELPELEQLAAVMAMPEWEHKKWVSHNTRFASRFHRDAIAAAYFRSLSYVGHCQRRLDEAETRLRRMKMEVKSLKEADALAIANGEEPADIVLPNLPGALKLLPRTSP